MNNIILNHKRYCILLFVSLIFFISNPVLAQVKTFIKDYVYQASDEDSKNSSRTVALREVKRLLLEELGTYLESITEVKNFHLTKDQITTLTAGIVSTEIISEKWDTKSLKYYLKAKISADPESVIHSIDELRQNREKTKELEDTRKRADVLLRENERLKEELKTSKGAAKERKQEEYAKGIKELSAIEWFEKGYAFQQSENHNKAMNAYSRAIELNPKGVVMAYYNRGNTYANLGSYHQAIRDYDKAIELNPKFSEAYHNRGAAYAKLRDYQRAIRDCGKAIELNPNETKAYCTRGIAYGGLSNHQHTIKDCDKAIELDPQFAKAYCVRGIAYGKLGNHQQAIMDFDKAIELNPKDAMAYRSRGIAYEKLGENQLAIENYKIAARLGDKELQNILRKTGINW
jgi:tetratricopeptide (TPR) repeat protein